MSVGEADASDVEDENALKRRERIREQALLHRTREEASAAFAENRKVILLTRLRFIPTRLFIPLTVAVDRH